MADRIEQQLREADARFERIVGIAADAIISIDEDQRIILFNEGAETIFGYAAEEALGQPLQMLIQERFRGARSRRCERTAKSFPRKRPSRSTP